MPVTPYVVGQWVREEKFYGRGEVIAEILDGNRNCLWLLGTRRIGKTSILKQLEHLTSIAERPRYFPLFWDFQGAEDVADLHEGFRDALFESMDRLETQGIDLDAVDDEDLFSSMSRLRRELRSRGLSLLLLGDEVEELVNIYEKDPRFLRRLRRALQSPENIRTVFASSIRLWSLASESATTSPFLHGFTPPLPVRGLEDDDARALVRQAQLPADFQPAIDEATVEAIRSRCNNHPYLLQLLSERTLESGNLETAIEKIAHDPMVRFFFGADLGMLSATERRILHIIDRQKAATVVSIRHDLAAGTNALEEGIRRLEILGFIDRSPQGEYTLQNYFFQRWFGEQEPEPASHPGSELPPGGSDGPAPRLDAWGPDAGGPGTADPESPTLRTPPPFSSFPGTSPRRVDGRYELLAPLGLGASGEVYRAHDAMLDTTVALKLLKREYCLDTEAVERLRREVVLARDLSHPNILRIYHLGDDRGQRYITMQYIDGPDLARVIATRAPLALSEALTITRKLAAALATLHHRQILHRDIKPSNVLLSVTGEPILTDFGLARLSSGPGITRNGIFLGTPAYASPEQAVGQPLDERSDLYALGTLLFEIITGRRPFVATSAQEMLVCQLREPAPPPRDFRPEIPEELSRLILRCLEKDPAQRFQSAAELYHALKGLQEGA